VYVTAITQSPYLLAMLDRLFGIYPSPARMRPDADELTVARAVVGRFDPHLVLEENSFVLRGECEFFYRDEPASLDTSWNEYCRATLRPGQGDVFVAVGHATPERLEPFLLNVPRRYPELAAALDQAADPIIER